MPVTGSQRPEQQSVEAVQSVLGGLHWPASTQKPPAQRPEQHSPAAAQVAPLPWQADEATHTPPEHDCEQQSAGPAQTLPAATQLDESAPHFPLWQLLEQQSAGEAQLWPSMASVQTPGLPTPPSGSAPGAAPLSRVQPASRTRHKNEVFSMPGQWGDPAWRLQKTVWGGVGVDFCNFPRPASHNGSMSEPALLAPRDLDLAGRCVSGDRAAQRELFQREKRRVHATLYRVLGSNAEMEDLVQESFIEVFKSLRNFRGEAQLSTWIDRITVRVAYAYLTRRRIKPTRLEAVPEMPDGDADAEQRALLREAARRMYEVLDKLDAKLRIAFSLHVIDGRPMNEVAEIMSASLVATKTRVWRARRAVDKRAKKDPLLAGFVVEEGNHDQA